MNGRIRTLKPEWLEDDKLNSCSDSARILSVAVILLADDYGNGRASINYLAPRVFPQSRRDKCANALKQLQLLQYLVLYKVNGQDYYSIKNWSRHQKIDKKGKPRVPGYLETEIRETPEKVPESVARDSESLATDQDQDQDQDQDLYAARNKPLGTKRVIRDPIRVAEFIENFNVAVKALGGAEALRVGLDPWHADEIIERLRSTPITPKEFLFAWFSVRGRKTHTLYALLKAAPQLIEDLRSRQPTSEVANDQP